MTKRLLFIEDDASVRDSLSRLLQETGYAVVVAADGREGARCLKQRSFDLLLLDLNLPKLSGFDILDLAVARYPALPIIILTGMARQCVPGSLIGADILLEKPPDVDLVLKTIQRLLLEPAEQRFRRLGAGRLGACELPLQQGNALDSVTSHNAPSP
jgi:DNA-binding response OmpR family regulator